MTLWLDPIPSGLLRANAVAALDAGDAGGFLVTASNEYGLDLVYFNMTELQARGLYERALLDAFIDTRTNNRHWPLRELMGMFEIADRERLRAAGDPLPGPGPFTIYRGVAGRGRARRVRGLSWTRSLERAQWFADRGPWFGLKDPAVFRVTVEANDVLAYCNGSYREEEEFIVLLPESARPIRVTRPRPPPPPPGPPRPTSSSTRAGRA